MLRKANNVFSVILDDAAKAEANLPLAATTVTDSNLAQGAVVVADLGNNRLSIAAFAALPANGQFRILQGLGAGRPLMKSPILTKSKVFASVSKHVAAKQQITIIGYNGTTGALPVANNTNYFIKIRKRDNDAANRSQPMSLFAGPVRTDATGTQAELATLLVANGYLNFKDEPANNYLKFEAICDAAGAVPTTTTTFAAVYGSRTVTVDALPGNVAVNDYIRLEGTGVTSPVYQVVSISGLSLVLNSPFTGTTATYAVANTRRITAVLAAAANFGVSLTGIQAPFNVNTFRDYYANRFTATFSDSSTLVSHMQGAFNGTGMWQQVAMDEYMSYGFEGENNQLAVPSTPRTQEVKIPGTAGNTSLTSKYSTLTLAWEETISGLVSMDGGKGAVVVDLNLRNAAGVGSLTTAASTGLELVNVLGPVYGFAAAAFNE
jgi:hypothetical protein